MTDTCLYFGCWNRAGHFLVAPGGRRSGLPNHEDHKLSDSLDSRFAPKLTRGNKIVWGDTRNDARDWERYNAVECPQGQFLRHELLGYSLIQWWDRNQGDTRGACNSTILLKGSHTSEELLAALKEHFPHVLSNLDKAGVELVEVFP